MGPSSVQRTELVWLIATLVALGSLIVALH